MKTNTLVFLLVCAVTLFWAGFEVGVGAERRAKDAACTVVPPMKRQSIDMNKAQQKRWIKYYLSKGG